MTDNNLQATETLRQQARKQVSTNLHRIARLVNKNFKIEERICTDEFIEEIKVFISKELDVPVDKVFIERTVGGEPDILSFGPYADEVLDLLIDREIKILENNMKKPLQPHAGRIAGILGLDVNDLTVARDVELNSFIVTVANDKQEQVREKIEEMQQNMALVNQAVSENKPLSLGAIGINSEDPEEIKQLLSQKLGIPADSIIVQDMGFQQDTVNGEDNVSVVDISLPQFHQTDPSQLETHGQIKTPFGTSVSNVLKQLEDTYGSAEEADKFKLAREMAGAPKPLKPYTPKHPPIKWTQVGGTRVQDPNRATSGSGGFDLYSTVRVDIPPGCNAKIGTGIKMAIPEGWVGIICPRSGVAAKSRVVPGARIIDSDYRGEIFIDLHNRGQDTFEVLKGERYVQIIFVPVNTNMEYVDSLDDVTERGEGGFGSTGVK